MSDYVKVTAKDGVTLYDTTPEHDVLEINLGDMDDYGVAAAYIEDVLNSELEGPDTMRLVRRIAQEFLSAHAEPLGMG